MFQFILGAVLGYNLLNDDRTDSRLEPLWCFENRMLLPWFKKLKG